jgi:hypothetical protein
MHAPNYSVSNFVLPRSHRNCGCGTLSSRRAKCSETYQFEVGRQLRRFNLCGASAYISGALLLPRFLGSVRPRRQLQNSGILAVAKQRQ